MLSVTYNQIKYVEDIGYNGSKDSDSMEKTNPTTEEYNTGRNQSVGGKTQIVINFGHHTKVGGKNWEWDAHKMEE